MALQWDREQPNWDWWMRRSWLEKDQARVSEWATLFKTLLRTEHPRQGLILILALVQARRDKDWKESITLTHVLDSALPIQERAPLLLALGKAGLTWDHDERISLGAMNQWRQQHAKRDDSALGVILEHVSNRRVCLLDGFSLVEQWFTLLPAFSEMDRSWKPEESLSVPTLTD